MILSKIESKEVYIFKGLLFIWILSIPFKNAIYQGSLILLISFFIYHVFKNKRFNILILNFYQTKILFIGFISIVLSMIISNLLNLELLEYKSWRSIYMFVLRYGVLFIILAYFYRLNFFTKKDIVNFLFFSFLLLVFTGIYQLIVFPIILNGEGVTGTLDNRNAFGLFMGMAVVLSLTILKDKTNTALFLILIFSFFMIFSFSRSSWIASGSAFLIFFLYSNKDLRLKYLVYLFLFIVFLLVLYISFESVQNRLKQLIEGYSSNRTEIWAHTIVFIKEKFLFGWGMYSWKFLPDSLLNKFPDPHNMTLEILIYTGFLGLTSCFFTITIVLIKIFKTKEFIYFPIATYFLIVTQFDFGAFGSKELLSFLTIFVFFVYSENFKAVK